MNPSRESHFPAGPDELKSSGGPDRVTRVSRVTPAGSPDQVLDDLAAVLAQGVLRLRSRAIAAAPAGEQGIVSSSAIPSESSHFGLEVCAPTRPCGSDTGVDAVGALGEAHASPTLQGDA